MNIFRSIFDKVTTHFRVKLVLTAATAVLITLLLSYAVGLSNLFKLKEDASAEVEKGLTKASTEYLDNYITTTALRLNLLLGRTFSELGTVAATMQTLIDHPETGEAMGEAIAKLPYFQDHFQYNQKSNWTQNLPGEPAVIAVWSYLLNPDGSLKPEIARDVAETTILDLIGSAVLKNGNAKLQVYYMGPKDRPIMRLAPYTDMAQTFDKLYPGHNEANFWDFFFPKAYEGWQGWIKDPNSKKVKNTDVTVSNPYIDAVTGAQIITFFQPLWNKERTDVAGAVAIDITLEQITDLIQNVQIAETGFAFLTQSNGNVLAVNQTGEHTLGLQIKNEASSGVTGLDRNLKASTDPGIANLQLPTTAEPVFQTVDLHADQKDEPYKIVLKQLEPFNFWNEKTGITQVEWTLGFVVPTKEIYASLNAAQKAIGDSTRSTIINGLIIGVFSLALTLFGVLIVSRRMTAGISELASAAVRIQNKEYDTRVQVASTDEIGHLGQAFNNMSSEIDRYTSNLEELVRERTADLEAAAAKITALNERLKAENLRMGAELDVARQLQLMVLPKRDELAAVHGLEIAACMTPADEVGGDYYDVLQFDNLVKIGIGDVTGHGLESGVVMLMVQSVARTLLENGEYNPVRFLSQLNRILCRNMHRINSDKSLTLSFIDFKENRLTLSGQHEEVIVLRNGGKIERIDTMNLGFPIGLEEDISSFISTCDIPLERGETVALYTDGITEAEDLSGDRYGIERLCACLSELRHEPAHVIQEGVIRDLRTYIGGQKVFDDISLLILKKTA